MARARFRDRSALSACLQRAASGAHDRLAHARRRALARSRWEQKKRCWPQPRKRAAVQRHALANEMQRRGEGSAPPVDPMRAVTTPTSTNAAKEAAGYRVARREAGATRAPVEAEGVVGARATARHAQRARLATTLRRICSPHSGLVRPAVRAH
eukprot:scaffold291575_cov30-Tisochrysis_lutea.AAC.2